MSLSSLPTELVRQIIESTASTIYLPEAYSERQNTLRSLCLVSRRFLHLARPILYEMISITSPAELDNLLDTVETRGRGDLLRQLAIIVEDDFVFEPGFDRLARISGHALQAIVMQIGFVDDMDLCFLQSFSGLVSLHLLDEHAEAGTFTLRSTILLPNLHSLITTYNSLDAAPALLDPEVVPSLKSLVISDLYATPNLNELDAKSNLSDLVPRLEVLQLSWNLGQDAPPFIQQRLNSILFDCYRYDLLNFVPNRPCVYHLRVIEGDYARRDPRHQLAEFTTWIENPAQTTLRSLYLDISLKNPSKLSPELAQLVNTLLRACEAKKVEVIFEVQPCDEGFGAVLSEEFCRRQRVKRMIKLGNQ